MQTSSAADFITKNKFVRMVERPSLEPSGLHSPRTHRKKRANKQIIFQLEKILMASSTCL
jgi:hypothetical protein